MGETSTSCVMVIYCCQILDSLSVNRQSTDYHQPSANEHMPISVYFRPEVIGSFSDICQVVLTAQEWVIHTGTCASISNYGFEIAVSSTGVKAKIL